MRRRFARKGAMLLGAGAFAGILLAGAPAFGQDDMKKDIEALKQTQQQILQQLQEIKQMLQARPPAAPPGGPNVKDVVFNLGSNPLLGSKQAGLTLVEFTDYQ
jgi:protein-disulfide isomerase